MGQLLLCSGKRAKYPYVLEDGKCSVYSLEELCYYSYQNIYFITSDYFSDRLLDFIKDDLELPVLSDKLKSLIEKKHSLEDIILALLSYGNYYRKEELIDFQKKLHIFCNLKTEERLKLAGDSYLEQKRYQQAIKQYQLLEHLYATSTLPERFWSNVFHNMGLAYLKMLYYNEAAGYMIRSYELISELSFLKDTAFVYYVSGNTVWYEKWKQDYPEGLYKEWEKEWEDKREFIPRKEKDVLENFNEGNMAEYWEQAEHLLDHWKQEYRKNMS